MTKNQKRSSRLWAQKRKQQKSPENVSFAPALGLPLNLPNRLKVRILKKAARGS